MGKLKFILIHCTATPEGREVTKADIEYWHKVERGWDRLGYSELINLKGELINLTPYNNDDIVDYNEMTWGVKGINGISRHIVYAGGLDKFLQPKDTRTEAQLMTMAQYIRNTIEIHPKILIAGHNDFANKACPCFNVADWLSDIGVPEINIYRKPEVIKLNKEAMLIHSDEQVNKKFATLDKEGN